MGLLPRISPRRTPCHLLLSIIGLSLFSFTALILYKVDNYASQTKTIVGHNLEPTPWHVFPRKTFDDESRSSLAYKIIQCSYLSCSNENPTSTSSQITLRRSVAAKGSRECPDFFRFIHRDLEPWITTGITENHLMEAKQYAAMRILILEGKLYVDLYYACVQSRAMFTMWGFVQLLKRYPGRVPDVDIMFDCMDKPIINRTEHDSFPLPLFRYCTREGNFDIPFPDWSFWGWSETNLRPWNEEFLDIKKGSKKKSWAEKSPFAFWKGNPDVVSPVRLALINCNDTQIWGAQIMRQNWTEEAKGGYEQSKLSNQCNYKYKIYAEGYAWSVSLKYILSCGSLTLIISPEYEDFFSRGLIPTKNYWPVSPENLCPSIKYSVDWGNAHPLEAETIGKRGQELMKSLTMERVYDYMFHLITEYAKLQKFTPTRPDSALEVCSTSILCFADPKQKELLERSVAETSTESPCDLPPADPNLINSWINSRKETFEAVRNREMQNPDAGLV